MSAPQVSHCLGPGAGAEAGGAYGLAAAWLAGVISPSPLCCESPGGLSPEGGEDAAAAAGKRRMPPEAPDARGGAPRYLRAQEREDQAGSEGPAYQDDGARLFRRGS